MTQRDIRAEYKASITRVCKEIAETRASANIAVSDGDYDKAYKRIVAQRSAEKCVRDLVKNANESGCRFVVETGHKRDEPNEPIHHVFEFGDNGELLDVIYIAEAVCPADARKSTEWRAAA